MKRPGKGSGRAVVSETEAGEGQGGGSPQLRGSEARDEKGRIKKGHTLCPGGVSKEKRAFLDRLKTDDAEEIYEALMDGVRAREWSVVMRAAEYLMGKPAAAAEDRASAEKAGRTILDLLTRDEALAIARGDKPE